jgi:glycosidase
MMRFEGLNDMEQGNLVITKKLTTIRNSSLALTYGDFYALQINEESYVFVRKYFEETAIVFFNKAMEGRTLEIKVPEWIDVDELQANFGNSFEWKDNKITMTLSPWSFEILSGTE